MKSNGLSNQILVSLEEVTEGISLEKLSKIATKGAISLTIELQMVGTIYRMK